MNVLIIMCDQLTASVLGCYGGAVPTPNIDRLAERGVRFTNAVCPTPYCTPSRASLITGFYPHNHGIVHNISRRDYPAVPSRGTEEAIKNRDVTTEQILNAAGYRTHHYGKWHMLDEDLDYYPDMFREHYEYADALKDVFTATRSQPKDSWMDWYGWALPVTQTEEYRGVVEPHMEKWSREFGWFGNIVAEFLGRIGRLDLPVEQTFEAMAADRAIDAISANDPRPFMVTCSFNLPHDPNVAPSPYYEMFDPAAIELPTNVNATDPRYEGQVSRTYIADAGESAMREFIRVYYAGVKLVDDQVGRVLRALDDSGKTDDTIVLFTADHGDMCGAHGMCWKSNDSFYDEIVRVPLILSVPGRLKAQTSAVAANLVDIMPTLLDLLGRETPGNIDGVSLVPSVDAAPLNRPPHLAEPRYAFSERMEQDPDGRRSTAPDRPGDFMIRGDGWKYCRYRDGEEFLYHLDEDPGEELNLVGNPGAITKHGELSNELDAWLSQRRGYPASMLPGGTA